MSGPQVVRPFIIGPQEGLTPESGPEQIVHSANGEWRYVLRQVGWLGHTGRMYSMIEDPSKTERGGFTPLLITAHGDRVEPSETEAQRQRERADHNAAAVNANADIIVALRRAAASERP